MTEEIQDFIKVLTHVKKYSIHTTTAYQEDLGQLAEFAKSQYDITKIEEINHLIIRSWMVSMTKEGITPKTINRKISSLNSFYKHLLKKGVVVKNPMLKITGPKQGKRLPSFVTESEVTKALDYGMGKNAFEIARNKLINTVLYATGIRRSELLNLTNDQIDFHRMEIRVIGKGKKQRSIPMVETLADEIKRYQAMVIEEFASLDHNYLVISNKGLKLNPRILYDIVHQSMASVQGTTAKSPHIWRHSFATHLLNSGADINAIKEILGHANLGATQVYTHNSIEKLKQSYVKFHPKA